MGKKKSSEQLICPDCLQLIIPTEEHQCAPERRGADPLIGQVVSGKYRVDKLIGSGGWSSVYSAQELASDRKVAIKFLREGIGSDQRHFQRFYQAARLTLALKHKNIAAVLDFGIEPRPYLVMEFLEGQNLAEIVEKSGPLTVERAVPIFVNICTGLRIAHDAGLVHRDVKPDNVMLVRDENGIEHAKIIDFGISKLAVSDSQLTSTGDTIGSPSYMSPEQCRGEVVDMRSDVYSVGCLMYEVVTGKLAFDGPGAVEVMRAHVSQYPESLSTAAPSVRIPMRLEEIIFKALAKDPDKRYQSITDLAYALKSMQDKPGASMSGQLARGQRKVLKYKREVLIVVVLIISVTCIVLGSLLLR